MTHEFAIAIAIAVGSSTRARRHEEKTTASWLAALPIHLRFVESSACWRALAGCRKPPT